MKLLRLNFWMIGVWIGWVVAPTYATDKPASSERYENLELFQKVLQFIENNYVDETKNKDLIYGAIKGMMETLDPHSNFLTPEVFREMKVDTSGKFGGLGIEVGLKDNILTVITPIEDTPAWRAGIKPGDRIVKIDGESTKGMTLSQAVSKMRGKKGTPITMSIYRDGFKKIREIKVKRDVIKIQSVKAEVLDQSYLYVRLTNFNESAAKDIQKIITQNKKKGPLKGLILDLRNNPGGLLEQAVDVTSLFIDEGVVVSTIGRNRDQKEVKFARKGMADKELPLAILVNSSTASAAEIVAGALQDHKRGIVLGQPTFGKGSVQTVVDLGSDLGLKLTVARYYTPSGRSIQERGVYPDILLEDYDFKLLAQAKRRSESIREKDLKGHIVEPEIGQASQEDFKKEELDQLAKSKDSEQKENLDDDLKPLLFVPAEDYQVKEALNYLKSYDVFKRMRESHGKS
jgi:carboxyl-terminal processing protease